MPASERDSAQAAMIDGALREAALLARATAAEALAGELAERLESLLIATAPGLTTHLDHEKDEARALLSRTKVGCLAQRPIHG